MHFPPGYKCEGYFESYGPVPNNTLFDLVSCFFKGLYHPLTLRDSKVETLLYTPLELPGLLAQSEINRSED